MIGARDDFPGRSGSSLKVRAEVATQGDFSCDQPARRLDDQTLRAIGPARNAHRYRARVGDCLFELLDTRHGVFLLSLRGCRSETRRCQKNPSRNAQAVLSHG